MYICRLATNSELCARVRSSTIDFLLFVVAGQQFLGLLNNGRLAWVVGVATVFLFVDVASTSTYIAVSVLLSLNAIV
jgi:hypothetical protein